MILENRTSVFTIVKCFSFTMFFNAFVVFCCVFLLLFRLFSINPMSLCTHWVLAVFFYGSPAHNPHLLCPLTVLLYPIFNIEFVTINIICDFFLQKTEHLSSKSLYSFHLPCFSMPLLLLLLSTLTILSRSEEGILGT